MFVWTIGNVFDVIVFVFMLGFIYHYRENL
jgi:hypothetical protein